MVVAELVSRPLKCKQNMLSLMRFYASAVVHCVFNEKFEYEWLKLTSDNIIERGSFRLPELKQCFKQDQRDSTS